MTKKWENRLAYVAGIAAILLFFIVFGLMAYLSGDEHCGPTRAEYLEGDFSRCALEDESKANTAPTTSGSSLVVPNTKVDQKPTVDKLYTLTNEERAKAGVPALQLDPQLNQSAQAKADDMVANNYYDHVSPVTGISGQNTIPAYKQGCYGGAENINAALTSAESIQEWMQSPAHKASILSSKYDFIGFGIVKNGDYYYVVQHFCDID